MGNLMWVAGVLLVVVGAEGGVLSGWDVAGLDVDSSIGGVTNSRPFSFPATTNDTGHVVAKLSLGEGVNPSTSINQYGFKISASEQTNSLVGAIAKNHYMEFSIIADEGYALSLGSIEMKGHATGTGCSNVVLMTSIDGYVAGKEIAVATNANTTGGFDTDGSGFGGPIDLSAGKYQNLTDAVSFRLYGWDSKSGAGTTVLRNLTGDDLIVFGEVVAISGSGALTLSFSCSNGTSSVFADFDGAATTNYVLQQCTNLASYDWKTISTEFTSDTNWMIESTNRSSFFRAIVE